VASPSGSSERTPSLDALRGLALLGVLVVNLVTAFRVPLWEMFLPSSMGTSEADHVVARIITIGLEFKAFILFSFLFGVGLTVQSERTRARHASFAPIAARRLAMLLAMGLAHMFLVWNGDILTLYAVVGTIGALVLGLRLSARALVPIAIALFVVQFLPLPFPTPFPSYDAMRSHIEGARMIYRFGTFSAILAFRIHEVRPISSLLLWSMPRTLGLFLLGSAAWRAGIFRGERRRLVRVIAAIGIVIGGAATWIAATRTDLRSWGEVIGGSGAIFLALGYGAAFITAFERPRIARVLSALAPLGRMALTSYLTQSIVLGFLFYGYGFGLFGRLGEARAAAIGLVIYVAQAVLAAMWLRRFRFGPVEWLWRSVTYAARQPLRK
jgi:uncharacterized protein